MGKVYTPESVLSGFQSTTTMNANFTAIEAALEDCLSLSGATPNALSANIDMGSNKIINLTDGTNNQDAVTVAQLNAATLGTLTTITLTGDVNAVNGVFSGDISCVNLTATTSITGGTIAGTTGTFSGAVGVASLASTGAVSGTTGTFSGAVSGTTGTFSSDVSGVAGTFSGALSGDSLVVSTTATVGSLSTTGAANVGSLVSTGAISGTTGTFSDALSGLTLAVNTTDLVVSGGTVGVGNATPQGDVEVTTTTSDSLLIRNTSETVADSVAGLKFLTGGGPVAATNLLGSISANITQATPSALKSELVFNVNTGDTSAQILKLDSNRTVTIGDDFASTPSVDADELVVHNVAGNAGLSITSVLAGLNTIDFYNSDATISHNGSTHNLILNNTNGAIPGKYIMLGGNGGDYGSTIGTGTTNINPGYASLLVHGNGVTAYTNTIGAGAIAAFVGSTDMAIQLQTRTNSATTAIHFGDSAGDYMSRIYHDHSVDNLIFDVNGVEALRLDSSQNIGIGVSSLEAWNSTYSALQIGGVASLIATTTAAAGQPFLISNNAYYDGAWKYIVTDEASQYFLQNGTHTFRVASSGTADTAISFTTALTIDNAANIGMGVTTPDGKLHVMTASAGLVTADANANDLVVENNATGGISILVPDASNADLVFGSPTDNTGAYVRWNYSSTLMSVGPANSGGGLSLRSGNFVEAIRVDSSQNVGFGISTLEAWASGYTGVQFGGNANIMASTSPAAGNFFYLTQNAYSDGAWKYQSTDEASMYRLANGTHQFYYAASGTADTAISWSTAMYIDTGHVGIRNTTIETWGSLYTALQIGGNSSIFADVSSGASKGVRFVQNAYFDGTNWKYQDTDEASYYKQQNGEHYFYTASSGTADTNITFTTAVTVENAGALVVGGDEFRVTTSKTPASATDTGTVGHICWDASYIYVCTATNTWVRAALATW